MRVISGPRRYDVVVVGARCAGAATAMLLARGGAKVLLIDRDAYGADTLSTHALMRTSVSLLSAWGVLPAVLEGGAQPVRRTLISYGSQRIEVPIKPSRGVDALYAPRRTTLDAALADAATAAGADVAFGVTLDHLKHDFSGQVNGVVLRDRNGKQLVVRADLVIGADGRNSTVARLAKAATLKTRPERTACVYGYFDGLSNNGYEWLYGVGVGAGMIPTDDGRHCVFGLMAPDRFKAAIGDDPLEGLARLFDRCSPEAGARLRAARLEGRLRKFGGAPGHLRQAHGRGWALVGDAGYFKDPITAHGITDALRDAELIARALLGTSPNGLAGYGATRDMLSLPLFDLTSKIASFDWSLEELKAHHLELNGIMKSEHAALFEGESRFATAA
ncbi:MAG: FAD-dependent monooxygenase [Pseudomonadota bacterium]